MSTTDRIILDTLELTSDLSELTGELPKEIFGLSTEDRISCPEPLVYSLRASLVGEGYLLEGQASTTIHCTCDRCLADYDQVVSTSRLYHFYEGIEDRIIDATDDIREDVVIAFPEKCLCDEDCRGICPECGKNLNTGSCECSGGEEPPDVWDELNGLDL